MLVLVAMAGCDALLRLDDIKPPRDDGGSDSDVPPNDACMQPVHCKPTTFAGGIETQYTTNGLGGLALSPGVTGEYVLENQKVYQAPMFGNSLQATMVSGVWARIALSPDGNELYLGGTTGMYVALWNGTAWEPPVLVPDFPSDGALATPGSSCGELRMMVKRSGAFEEWTRIAGAWQPTRLPLLTQSELTAGAFGVNDPSLSSDGLVLVFAATAGGTSLGSGVYATTRQSIGDSFTTPAVQILSFTTVVTPFLSEDCLDLYFEAGQTDLYHWTH